MALVLQITDQMGFAASPLLSFVTGQTFKRQRLNVSAVYILTSVGDHAFNHNSESPVVPLQIAIGRSCQSDN